MIVGFLNSPCANVPFLLAAFNLQLSANLDESDFKLIALLVIGACAGIVFFVRGLKRQGWIRLIENIPTSTVRSVAIGLAEVKGKAHPFGETLSSPLSKSLCVYYQYKVQELRRRRRTTYWATVAKGESNLRFLLRDETGEIPVSPVGASMNIAIDRRFSNTWSGGGVPSEVIQALEELGVNTQSWLGFRKTMKVEESFIEPGDQIYVMGTADLAGSSSQPGSGSGIVIRKGKNNRFFFISDKSEKELLKSFRVKVLFEVYGGAALCLGCLGAFLKLYVETSGASSYFATLN